MRMAMVMAMLHAMAYGMLLMPDGSCLMPALAYGR
jgi:hypothetical protein